jgi:hypothetical protein
MERISATTRSRRLDSLDAEMRRNCREASHLARRPEGLGRRTAICCVSSPERVLQTRLHRRALHLAVRRSQRTQVQVLG